MLPWWAAAAILGAAAALDVAAALWVRRRRGAVGRVSLVVLLLAAAVWSGSYALELVTRGRAMQEFWGSAEYLGVVVLPVAWLAFVLEYTGRRDQVRRRLLVLLAVEPVVVLTMLAVPAWHGLIRSFAPGPLSQPPDVEVGPVYWAHFAYSNAVIAVGTVLLVVRLLRVSSFYRRQSVTLLAAVVVPLLGNAASSVEVPWFRQYDPTPVTVSIGVLVLVWGIFRYRLLDLVPVARTLMFERLSDPVLVVDAYGRIVDRNPAAARLLGASAEIGLPARALLEAPGAARLDATPSGPEVRLGTGDDVREFELAISELRDERDRAAGSLVHLRDITARKQAERRLRWLADYDALTGLPNRRLLQDRLGQAIARGRRSRGRCALLLVDVDRFKRVNDSLGHAAGDRVLAMVAERLQRGRRAEDTAARLGGDEFAVLLPEVSSPEDAALVADRVLAVLSEPFTLDGRELIVTASVGVAVWPDDATDAETLFSRADAAMYRAKAHGRNRAETGTAEADDGAGERLELGVELWHAIRRDELRLLFQPLVDLRDGSVVGLEALLRWQHPRLGLLPPGAFVPVAEEAGMAADLDRWVLRRACAEAAGWAGRPVAVTVNVCPSRFGDAPLTLADDVALELTRSGLPAERLIVEINERTVISDPEPVAHELGRLRRLGVGVALDDFGAGHTSLTHLRRLPIGMLKIDIDLVRGVGDPDTDHRRVLAAVTTLAHILGMTVTAEGVERQEQLQVLQETGCNAGQGFLFSPPVDGDAAAGLVADRDLVSG